MTEMIDPDRSVDQRHAVPDRRRGIGRSRFWEPPRWARRRALSRAMRVSRPRWMRAVFSRTPVNWAALLINSSSRFRVVRMQTNMHYSCRCVKRGCRAGATRAKVPGVIGRTVGFTHLILITAPSCGFPTSGRLASARQTPVWKRCAGCGSCGGKRIGLISRRRSGGDVSHPCRPAPGTCGSCRGRHRSPCVVRTPRRRRP